MPVTLQKNIVDFYWKSQSEWPGICSKNITVFVEIQHG